MAPATTKTEGAQKPAKTLKKAIARQYAIKTLKAWETKSAAVNHDNEKQIQLLMRLQRQPVNNFCNSAKEDIEEAEMT